MFKKQNRSLIDKAFFSVVETFSLKGYDFEEIRILSLSDGLETLTSFENLLLVCEREELATVKNSLVKIFPQGIYQGGLDGVGIYQSQISDCFLLTTDSGEKYAKEVCVPYLEKKYQKRYEKYVVRCVGANQAYVRRLLEDVSRLAGDKLFYKHSNEYAEDIIELFYDVTIPKNMLDEVIRIFVEGLGESIYAVEDISLEEQLVRLLKLRSKKLSVAESFTGGGVASRIVSVSGASEVFFEGINAYNERSKMKRLNVSQFTLKTQSAVSDQTAYEMAAGLIGTGDCDISIATTGLAGPKTDRSMLPVGLCYIAVGTKEKVLVYRYQLKGCREEITKTAINYAMFLAYKQLKDI